MLGGWKEEAMCKYKIILYDTDGSILSEYTTDSWASADNRINNYFSGIEPGMKIIVEVVNVEG